MRFYNATAFIFPRSYERRILLICLAGTALPLLVSIALLSGADEWHPALLAVLMLASFAGSGLCLAAIHALLMPVTRAVAMLGAIQRGQRVGRIPAGGDDVIGRLLRSVVAAADEAATRAERHMDPAERDPLTGIRNRDGLLNSAEAILHGDHNAVLALIDIDHFDLINEQCGKGTGNDLLKAFARRLHHGLRRSDIAARWGEDEFAVLLPDTTLDEARMVMERLRAGIALDAIMGEQGWPVTFSCGLAPIRNFTQFENAARQADAALSRARNSGQRRVFALLD